MEFSSGNYGLLEAALEYSRDTEDPVAVMTGARASTTAIETTFKWINEPSVIHFTMDGSTPTLASPMWQAQAPRAPGQVFTVEETTTFKWIAKDLKGNVSDVQTATFAIDTAAPTTTASLSPPEQGGFHRNPTVTLSATDDGAAGVDRTEYSLDGGPTTVYSGPFQVTGDGSHTLSYFSTDKAGNAESPRSLTFQVDGTNPSISIAAPAAGASYLLGSSQLASYSCSDALSGLASCVGPVASGSAFNTSSVGFKTFTVNAADNAGNTASSSVQYNVHWPFSWRGNIKPGRITTVGVGNDVKVKFSLGGYRGLDVIAAGYPQSAPVSCSAPAARAAKAALGKGGKRTLARSAATLRFKDGLYEYTWDTSKSWKGTCRTFILKLVDNTTHTATYRFTRSETMTTTIRTTTTRVAVGTGPGRPGPVRLFGRFPAPSAGGGRAGGP